MRPRGACGAERTAGQGRARCEAHLVGVFECTMPPGGGFPFAHVHDEHEEVFSVLEGEVEYRLGEVWTVATVGSTICVPPGVVHALCNSSRYPARHLVVHAPPTALEMMEEIGQALRDQWDGILESTGRDPSTAEAPAICRYT